MKEAFIWCYPWDLEADGLDAALGRIAGELGLDAVSIAATHRAVRRICPRAADARMTFCAPAGATFQPDARRYTGRIRPQPSTWLKSRNMLERVVQAAERQRLARRLWVVCCENDTLAQRHAHAACVNWLGDASDSRLCPAQPDVRQYVIDMVDDLANSYAAETIELDAIGFSPVPLVRYEPEVESDGMDDLFSSWCFCAACGQRAADAGVDPVAIVRRLHERLRRRPSGKKTNASSLEDAASDDAFRAYERMRVETVASLVRAIRAKVKTRLVLHVPEEPARCAVDVGALQEHVDGFVTGHRPPVAAGVLAGRGTRESCPNYESSPADKTSTADALSPLAAWHRIAPARMEVSFVCYPPHTRDGPTLVSAVHEASQHGCAAVGFHDYGAAPEPCLEWVRQAVRYARRESRD